MRVPYIPTRDMYSPYDDGYANGYSDGYRERDGEIVRCRDCRHYTEDEMEFYQYCNRWCEQVEPDGFCAWGERRRK